MSKLGNHISKAALATLGLLNILFPRSKGSLYIRYFLCLIICWYIWWKQLKTRYTHIFLTPQIISAPQDNQCNQDDKDDKDDKSDPNGPQWIPMDWNGPKWIKICQMDQNGTKLIPMDPNWSQLISMGFSGLQWIQMVPMNPNGY